MKMTEYWKTVSEKLDKRLGELLDDIKLKHKLIGMFLICVLLPLFVTDGVILFLIVQADRDLREREMHNTADAVFYNLNTTVENAANLAQNIYQNRFVNRFIEKTYASALDYYNSYQDFLGDTLYESVMGSGGLHTVIYADNPGVINGGYFCRVETVQDRDWYREFSESGKEIMLIPHFEELLSADYNRQKRLSIVRRLDYYHKGRGQDVLRMDLDYSAITRSIINAHYGNTVYVCSQDRILFSNDGRGGIRMPFEYMGQEMKEAAGLHRSMLIYGSVWDIYVMRTPMTTLTVIRENLALIVFLIFVNIFLPFLLVRGINRSFTLRLRLLGRIFEEAEGDRLEPLPQAKGKDEIGTLMRSYNRMANRMNELIQTVYKDRVKQQEMDIARQAAELLALHSQINPHFLFNALESIRMHSVLKKEYETAEMVERLALMQRQNVEWNQDLVTVVEEVRSVEAYLELQKYRFGEKLSYRIEIDPACENIRIPKLTLVTFVENACVHGMEGKATPGWIFVRVCMDGGKCWIEVEDTGVGMSQQEAWELQEKMNHADISQLQEKGRVGILNACIRLKITTENRVLFELDSEEGVGTTVMITIPLPAEGKEGLGTC